MLFTQGINEEQTLANLWRTNTAEQLAINMAGLRNLNAYYGRLMQWQPLTRAHEGAVQRSATRCSDAARHQCSPPRSGSQGGPVLVELRVSALNGHSAVLVTARLQHVTCAASASQGGCGSNRQAADSQVSSLCATSVSVTAIASPLSETRAPPVDHAASEVAKRLALAQQQAMLASLHGLLRRPAEQKNIELLELTSELTRALGGGRVTMCKSGKDRTSMSLTLEHGRLLHAQHRLDAALVAKAVHVMRRRGVRRENVRLNTAKRLYAFNWLQQSMLPEPYRPPDGSAKGGKA